MNNKVLIVALLSLGVGVGCISSAMLNKKAAKTPKIDKASEESVNSNMEARL